MKMHYTNLPFIIIIIMGYPLYTCTYVIKQYNLVPTADRNIERHHNKVLIPKTADLNDRDFLVRNVYRGIY